MELKTKNISVSIIAEEEKVIIIILKTNLKNENVHIGYVYLYCILEIQ